jgi:hypothetical protein
MKILLLVALFASTALAQDAAQWQGFQPITLRIAGSTIVDVKGEMSGNVEAVVLDGRNGQIQFALVSTEFPSNRLNVTPVPWQALQHRYDARTGGGIPGTFQQFTLPVDRTLLARAPRLQSDKSAQVNDLAWMTASLRFFQSGGTAVPPNAGAPASATGVQSQTGAAATTTPAAGQAVAPNAAVGTVVDGSVPAPGAGVEVQNRDAVPPTLPNLGSGNLNAPRPTPQPQAPAPAPAR